MFSHFCKNIKNYSGKKHNALESQQSAHIRFSSKSVSQHLENFLKEYFHPYHFFISTNVVSLRNFSTLLFEVNKIESDNCLSYKVIPAFDPAAKLLSRVINKDNLDNLDMGFKI